MDLSINNTTSLSPVDRDFNPREFCEKIHALKSTLRDALIDWKIALETYNAWFPESELNMPKELKNICGLDYDVLWQSQDPNYKVKLNYSLTPNGQVKVKIGKESVNYTVACTGNSCKITDVFSDGSVTKMINKECR